MTRIRRKDQAWLLSILAGCLVVSCHRTVPPATMSTPYLPPSKPEAGLPWFKDVTADSGINFQHFDSGTDKDFMQERMGSGLGWIDYNQDGRLDLFCVQDGPVYPATHQGLLPTSKLFRNNGDGTFTDVTEEAGLARAGFGMGCAVGDYDNDGFDDLLVTYFGEVVLYHNEPDGKGHRKFAEVTQRAGLKDSHWATSAAWGDLDNDGFLDLYICNYVEIDVEKYHLCEDPHTHLRHHCPPTVFPMVPHQLYRNNGNRTFTDISKSSGIAAPAPGPGLGVVMMDLDGDGLLDIYVANDLKPAYLFHNLGNMRFEENALLSGCGLGPRARAVAGMGVDAGDIDGTGRPSLVVTNFQLQGTVLYRNQGMGFFQDWSNQSGLGPATLQRLGFGAVFFDPDLDGQLDFAQANGHVYHNANKMGQTFAQESQLFRNDGKASFQDVSGKAGDYFRQRYVGRGLAWADYDNDGKPDLAFSNNAGPAVLLRNGTVTDHHWLGLELVGDGKKSNRNAIGVRVEIEAGGSKQVRFVNGGGSYLSASDRRLLIGLGKAEKADRVVIHWPSGQQQELKDVAGGKWQRIQEKP